MLTPLLTLPTIRRVAAGSGEFETPVEGVVRIAFDLWTTVRVAPRSGKWTVIALSFVEILPGTILDPPTTTASGFG